MALESKYFNDGKGGGDSIRLSSIEQTSKALVTIKLR
jgi:hypothetical protein